jgi:hypothetical protein
MTFPHHPAHHQGISEFWGCIREQRKLPLIHRGKKHVGQVSIIAEQGCEPGVPSIKLGPGTLNDCGLGSPPGTASASTDPPIRSTFLYKILYPQLLQWEARNIRPLERPKRGLT